MVVDYEYLKKWLSREEIRKIREGDNEAGIVLTRQQTYRIMTGKSRNNTFLNILIKRAKENESLRTLNFSPLNK